MAPSAPFTAASAAEPSACRPATPKSIEPRAFCYSCHKPQAFCLCALAEPVANRCAITILQHPRERHHPIGTARLCRLALEHAQVMVCWRLRAPEALMVQAQAAARRGEVWGVLFPSPHATDLRLFASAPHASDGPMAAAVSDGSAGAAPPNDGMRAAQPAATQLPPSRVAVLRPTKLIVLDGTWAHARSLYRHNLWLQSLPHYRITPEGQDRYRIRREPKAEYTSTLEAIVTALLHLEPDTPKLTGILSAFDTMIDRQVTCIETLHEGARRRTRPKSRPRSRGIPQTLLTHPERNVVVFAEFMQHTVKDKTTREMVYLTAVRLSCGRSFAQFIQPHGPSPTARHLEHMQLTASQMRRCAVAPAALAQLWARFTGADAQVLAWNQATLDLIADLGAPMSRAWLLKAMFAAAHRQRGGTLGDAVKTANVCVVPADALGRASIRLGSALAIAKHLIARGQAALSQ